MPRVHIKSEGAVREFGLLPYPFALSDMRDLHCELCDLCPQRVKRQRGGFVSGAKELRGAIAALDALKYPQSFPDDTPARVIRKAILSGSIYSKNCTLVLTLPTDSAVPVPVPVSVTTNPN